MHTLQFVVDVPAKVARRALFAVRCMMGIFHAEDLWRPFEVRSCQVLAGSLQLGHSVLLPAIKMKEGLAQ